MRSMVEGAVRIALRLGKVLFAGHTRASGGEPGRSLEGRGTRAAGPEPGRWLGRAARWCERPVALAAGEQARPFGRPAGEAGGGLARGPHRFHAGDDPAQGLPAVSSGKSSNMGRAWSAGGHGRTSGDPHLACLGRGDTVPSHLAAPAATEERAGHACSCLVPMLGSRGGDHITQVVRFVKPPFVGGLSRLQPPLFRHASESWHLGRPLLPSSLRGTVRSRGNPGPL